MTKTKSNEVLNPRTNQRVKIALHAIFAFVNDPKNAKRTLADCQADFDIFCDAKPSGGGVGSGESTYILGTQTCPVIETNGQAGTAIMPVAMCCSKTKNWYLISHSDVNPKLENGDTNPTYRHLVSFIDGISFPPAGGKVCGLWNNTSDPANKEWRVRNSVKENAQNELLEQQKLWNAEFIEKNLSLADAVAESSKREKAFLESVSKAFNAPFYPPEGAGGFVDVEAGDGSGLQATLSQLDANGTEYKTPRTG